MKRFLTILFIFAFMFSLCACSLTGVDASKCDTYIFAAMEYDSFLIDGADLIDGDPNYIILKEDGSAELHFDGDTSIASWSSEGDDVHINGKNGILEAHVNDGILFLESIDAQLVYATETAELSSLDIISLEEYVNIKLDRVDETPDEDSEDGDTPEDDTDVPSLIGDDLAIVIPGNGSSIVINYSGDCFVYDEEYQRLKAIDGSPNIYIEVFKGPWDYDNLRMAYISATLTDEHDRFSETSVNGYRALKVTHDGENEGDMHIDIDFEGDIGGLYGISFFIHGDDIWECNSDPVWHVINSIRINM